MQILMGKDDSVVGHYKGRIYRYSVLNSAPGQDRWEVYFFKNDCMTNTLLTIIRGCADVARVRRQVFRASPLT